MGLWVIVGGCGWRKQVRKPPSLLLTPNPGRSAVVAQRETAWQVVTIF